MVKDHSDSERGNPLPPHGLLFSINSKGSLICTTPDRIAHTTAFVTPVVDHWLEREITQWVHSMTDRSDDPSHHKRTLLPRSYISLPHRQDNIIITVSVTSVVEHWLRRDNSSMMDSDVHYDAVLLPTPPPFAPPPPHQKK